MYIIVIVSYNYILIKKYFIYLFLRRTILSGARTLPHPHSISAFEDSIFLSDWTKLNIARVNKYQGSEGYTQLLDDSERIFDLAVVHPLKQTIGNDLCISFGYQWEDEKMMLVEKKTNKNNNKLHHFLS